MMITNNRKATLQAIHTHAVKQEVNLVFDDRVSLIHNSEKDLTMKERTTLAQLRSGHGRLIGSYESRINKDAVCGRTTHDVKHLFNCPSHPRTQTPSDLWSKPVDVIWVLCYLEAGCPDRDEPD